MEPGKLRVLIVDDEPAARRKTRRFLEEHEDVEVIGEAANGASAVERILEDCPDLVFLDVQMPDIDGFDVVEAIAGAEQIPKIIFVTAHDRYAVRAFEVNALDYLLKPFDRERFAQALSRSRSAGSPAPAENQLMTLLESLRPGGRFLRRLLVPRDGRSIFVSVEDVVRFESERNNVQIETKRGSFTIRMTLDALEQRLDPEQFARVHRSHIVNLDSIKEIDPWFHGDYKITLTDGSSLTWSRRFAAKRPDLLRLT